MVKTLKERLHEESETYRKNIAGQITFQEFLDKIPLSVEVVGVTVYSDMGRIYINSPSIEHTEMVILPQLTDAFNVKWKRIVSEDKVNYIADIFNKYHLYIYISVIPEDSCEIIKVPTGKTKKVKREVWVEEQEFETVVNCREGDYNV